jgi:hypothetical protein
LFWNWRKNNKEYIKKKPGIRRWKIESQPHTKLLTNKGIKLSIQKKYKQIEEAI